MITASFDKEYKTYYVILDLISGEFIKDDCYNKISTWVDKEAGKRYLWIHAACSLPRRQEIEFEVVELDYDTISNNQSNYVYQLPDTFAVNFHRI